MMFSEPILWCVIHCDTSLAISLYVEIALDAEMAHCQIAAILLALASVNFKIFEGEQPFVL